MIKMRVYEYAKENKVSSKVVIEKLEALGFAVKSHMSVIEDNAIHQLNKQFQKKPVAAVQAVQPKKKTIEGKVTQTTKTKEKQPSRGSATQEKKQQGTGRFTNNNQIRSSDSQAANRNQRSNGSRSAEGDRGARRNNNRRGGRSNGRRRGQLSAQSRQKMEIKLPEKITISGSLTVGQFAEKLGRPSTDIIKKLMALGVMATKNQDLDKDTIELLAGDYGVGVEEE
ncbi:MAG: translation initiation factor IF-2 N-terminal domain-containing protein, partial [Sporolactobacillus sp.]